MRRARYVAALLLVLAAGPAPAQDKKGPRPLEVRPPGPNAVVSYSDQVVEILEDKCTGCHGSALAEKRLSLETVPAMIKGGRSGPALVPGKAAESLLFRMAAHRVEPVMPPADKPGNTPLTPEQLGLLQAWIDAGAKDDSGSPEAPAKPKEPKAIALGELPPGVQPVGALDLTAAGNLVAVGRANVVQLYDVDSGLEVASLGGHKDLIQSVRFSPDGSLLAAGSYQYATLWEVPRGSAGPALAGHKGPAAALAASADGKTVWTGGQDGTVRAWEAVAGKAGPVVRRPGPVSALAASADGRSLAVGSADGRVAVLAAADGKELAAIVLPGGAVEGLAFLAPEGGAHRVAATWSDGKARIVTLATPAPAADKPGAAPGARAEKKEVAQEPAAPRPIELIGHKGKVGTLTATADGQQVITGGEDGTVRRWDASGKPGAVTEAGPGAVLALAASADGRALAVGSADGSVRLLGPGDGPPRPIGRHPGPVRSVAFSPDGRDVAVGWADGGIKVWGAATGRAVMAFGHRPAGSSGAAHELRRLTYAGAGRLVSAGDDGVARTWAHSGSWATRAMLGPHAFRVLAIDFSPDGRLAATGGGDPSRSGEVKLWNVADGSPVRSLDSLHSDTVFALRFSPDGAKLASGAADKFLKVTSAADGKELRSFEGHTHHVMAVDWKSDGKQIVTGGADKVLKLWDFESGEQVRTLPEAGKQITAARWIPGKPEVAAASGDAQVRIYNPDSGTVTRTFSGPADYVLCVAASADGARVAAGVADGNVFVWDGRGGALLRKLGPVPGAVPTTVLAR